MCPRSSLPALAAACLVSLLACGAPGGDEGGGPPTDPLPATDGQLARFHQARLEASFWTERLDGLAGLAHLGPSAAAAVPTLVERAEGRTGFEPLAALWALARIDTGGATPLLRARADRERERLLEGDLREVAARTAFLAAVHGDGPPPRFLDRALPSLYYAARGRRGTDRGQPLLAAWALLEVGTEVTRETAGEALGRAAAALDPEEAAYGRKLLYARLVGPPARHSLSGPLQRILASHEFGSDFDRDRVRTLYTLAALHHPDLPAELVAFRQRLAEGLGHPLSDDRAIRALLTLGPHGCSERTPEGLDELLGRADDAADREQARRGMEMCGGP